MKILGFSFVSLFLLFTIGCHKESGPFERVGERADEIGDNIEKGKPVFHKPGVMEKAGESIDETFNPDRRK